MKRGGGGGGGEEGEVRREGPQLVSGTHLWPSCEETQCVKVEVSDFWKQRADPHFSSFFLSLFFSNSLAFRAQSAGGENYHQALCKKPDRWRHCLLCSARCHTATLPLWAAAAAAAAAAFIHSSFSNCSVGPEVKAKTGPHHTMRVCSLCVTPALGFGGFAQEASRTSRVFSARRWTGGLVNDKVLYYSCCAPPLLHSCTSVSPGILSSSSSSSSFSFTERFLPAT